MLLEQLVDILHLHARALRDALLARGVDHVGIAPFLGRHRQDDSLLALELALVDLGLGHRGLGLHGARQHAHQPLQAAHLAQLAQLVEQVVHVELALADLGRELLGIFLVDRLGGALDQRDDVAHAEDARGNTIGMERLQRVELFADADQLDRAAGDGAHRQRRTTAGIAVDAGQHDAGDGQPLVEGLGHVHGVLAGHGVGDEQRLRRLGQRADVGHFLHQLFVDGEAAGGVEDQDVEAFAAGLLERAARDRQRHFQRHDRQRGDAGLLTQDLELLLRRRAAGVERGHHDLALDREGAAEFGRHALRALAEAIADLGAGRGLAGALEADHQDDDRRNGVEVEVGHRAAQHLDQVVVDDLDDHLARRDRADDIGADGLGTDRIDEVADDRQRHVGFEQGGANLAQGRVDVSFGERPAPPQLVEYVAQTFAQTFKHARSRTPFAQTKIAPMREPSRISGAPLSGNQGGGTGRNRHDRLSGRGIRPAGQGVKRLAD